MITFAVSVSASAIHSEWRQRLVVSLRELTQVASRRMFPVQPQASPRSSSLESLPTTTTVSRSPLPSCLLQVQFLSAQQHLECGHWRPQRQRQHTLMWSVCSIIKLLSRRMTAHFPENCKRERRKGQADRCGLSLQQCSGAQTHLRQRRSAQQWQITSLTLKAAPPFRARSLFLTACQRWQVQSPSHVRPGSVGVGHARSSRSHRQQNVCVDFRPVLHQLRT